VEKPWGPDFLRFDLGMAHRFWCGGLARGAPPPLGLVLISLGAADNGHWRLQLALGRRLDPRHPQRTRCFKKQSVRRHNAQSMLRFPLHPHANTQAAAVRALYVVVRTAADGMLTLDFSIDADAESVVFPPPRPAGFSDGLWRHTCFELFAAGEADRYREFNFSPSTEFAIYDFESYRAAMRPVAAPPIEIHRGGSSIQVRVPGDLLMLDHRPVRKIGIAAVIEERGGTLSYWALHHPADKPDFHDRTGFVVSWPASAVV